ncbi:hypothetical protein A2U01_0088751, partial [Trifolium medium]|nr:hypothetical protein [Trifolium medium]
KPKSKTKSPVPSTANTTPSAGKRSQRSDDAKTPARSAAETEPEKNDTDSGETPKAVHGGGNTDELPVVTQYHKA